MRSSLWIAATFGGAAVTAIATIEAVGNKFFTSTGAQFFMKGMEMIP
jgi:hypothetical protein